MLFQPHQLQSTPYYTVIFAILEFYFQNGIVDSRDGTSTVCNIKLGSFLLFAVLQFTTCYLWMSTTSVNGPCINVSSVNLLQWVVGTPLIVAGQVEYCGYGYYYYLCSCAVDSDALSWMIIVVMQYSSPGSCFVRCWQCQWTIPMHQVIIINSFALLILMSHSEFYVFVYGIFIQYLLLILIINLLMLLLLQFHMCCLIYVFVW